MQRRERDYGLTWIGVVVVFGILALLAGLLFPGIGGHGCGESAGRAAAGTSVRSIVAALKSYHNDYGHFPEIRKPRTDRKFVVYVGDPACKMSESSNGALFDVLRAIPRGPNANHALNPRQQKYFEARIARNPKYPRDGFGDGPQFSAKDQGCLFDPWGRQYCIAFTTDGSGTLDLSAVYSDLAGPEHLIRSPVAAFSLGKDGIPGGKGYEGKFRKPASSQVPDDIFSWW